MLRAKTLWISRASAWMLAGAAAVMAGSNPVGAAEVDRLTGEKGSYVILVGRERPLAAWYWIGPQTLLGFPSETSASVRPGANQLMVTDRGLLPRTLVYTYSSQSRNFDYGGDPVVAGGRDVAIPVQSYRYSLRPTPGDALQRLEERSYTISLHWLEPERKQFPSALVEVQRYEAENLSVIANWRIEQLPDRVRRVYLPAFDVDLDPAVWDQVVDVRWGTGLAASSDMAFETWLASDLDQATAACLSKLRATEDYRHFAEEFAALEWRSTVLLPIGASDILALGAEGYTELGQRINIRVRFNDCVEGEH